MSKNKIVIGLDILSGTSSSGKREKKSKFAAVIISGGDDISKISVEQELAEINVFDIIKLVQTIQPDLLAFDNIFEIAQNSKEILNLSRQLPDQTTIVQVTGSPNSGYQKLSQLAKTQSLNSSFHNGKLRPLDSANLIAQLAFLGVGYKVVPFEDEIKVVISKTRKIGKGGWSAPRYERNIKISVKAVSDELISRLDVLEVDFDTFIYPKRTVVIVRPDQNHPITFAQLIAISKRISNDLAKSHVSHIPKSSLEFIPLSGQAPSKIPSKIINSIIVGIDPGTTTGLAIIDARSGRLLALHSAREFGTSQIIRMITRYGKTVLTCSDVKNPIPHLVKKLSTILNAQIYAPDNPKTPRSEKRSLVQAFLDDIDYKNRTDNHERDALFAALKGYGSIKKLIIRIKSSLVERPELSPRFNSIIDNVISGLSLFDAIVIAEAFIKSEQLNKKISLINDQKDSKISPEIMQNIENQSQRIEELYLSLKLIEREKTNFQAENKRLEKNLKLNMKKLDQVKRQKSLEISIDRRVEQKNREIQHLHREIKQRDGKFVQAQKTIDSLKKIRLIWQRGDLLALKPVKKLHEEELHLTQKELGIRPGDILLLIDPSGGSSSAAKWLIERGIRAVVIPKGFLRRLSTLATRVFEEAEIPLFEEGLVSYDLEQPVIARKKKVVHYEGLYIINKRYILSRIYEQELHYIKIREDQRIKTHQEERIQEIPVNKDTVELLLEAYQERRMHQRLIESKQNISEFDDYDENGDF